MNILGLIWFLVFFVAGPIYVLRNCGLGDDHDDSQETVL